MVKWSKPKSIGWGGAFGVNVKIGYWLFALQRGFPLLTRNVSGNAVELFVFVNVPSFKRIFFVCLGDLPHRPRPKPFRQS